MRRPYLRRRCTVHVYRTRELMGLAAAEYTASAIRMLLRQAGAINVMFAAAPSQDAFLTALTHCGGDINWGRVRAFHMDEYLGLPAGAEQLFSTYLTERIFGRLPFRQVHYILRSGQEKAKEACARYAKLLESHPLDIVCMGIGENAHIAFNDPEAADFDDPHSVKIVQLDRRCREQQVSDGCFTSLEAVPTRAITVTVPALMSARRVVCVVPGERKREAVQRALEGPVTTKCPASILRRHGNVALFLDAESASNIINTRVEVR